MTKRAMTILLCASLVLAVAGIAGAKGKIIIWGVDSIAPGGNKVALEEFSQTHPDIEVDAQVQVAGSGMTSESMQKLLTAIAGGTPPDVTYIDRFTVAGWAARGALQPLNDLIERDSFPIEDYYPSTLDEGTLDGDIYAIPLSTDNRLLFWNKQLFAEAGLDPDRPPYTWDETIEYAKKLTKVGGDGTYQVTGWYNPMKDWLYLPGWLNGGDYLTPDGKTATLNAPEIVEALEWMTELIDVVGGAERLTGFTSGFGSEAEHPFLTGKVAMNIQGNWQLNTFARYAPDLEFGLGAHPVPEARYRQEGKFAGEPVFLTWSGGHAFAIPKGAKNRDDAWEWMKWWLTEPGNLARARGDYEYNQSMNRPWVPGMSAHRPSAQLIADKYMPLLDNAHFTKCQEFAHEMMEVSRYRPLSPVGQKIWEQLVAASDNGVYKKMSAQKALDEANKNVQRELDRFWKDQK